MRLKGIAGVTALCMAMLCRGPVFSSSGALETILTTIETTRSQGLGGSGVSIAQDVSMAWVNPAAIANVASPTIVLSGYREFFDEMTGQIQGAMPFRKGAVTAAVTYSDAGTEEILTLDGVSRTMSLQQDFLVCVGYARPLTGMLALGASAKVLHSTILEEYSTDMVVGDVGVQIRPVPRLQAGLALQNFGTQAKYLDEPLDAPMSVRAGAGAEFPLANEDALLLVGDVQYGFVSEQWALSAGAEYMWKKLVVLRAGIRESEQTELGNYSMGLGLQTGLFRMNYSVRLSREYSMPQSLSLTIAL